jgi:hypothetical protein
MPSAKGERQIFPKQTINTFILCLILNHKNTTMAKFILIIREDLSRYPIAEEKLNAIIKAHSNWARDLTAQGKFVDGYGIPNDGHLVERIDNNIVASPLRDIKEGIGGFYILEVADMDEAIAIAKNCPTFDEGDIIEVRPLM